MCSHQWKQVEFHLNIGKHFYCEALGCKVSFWSCSNNRARPWQGLGPEVPPTTSVHWLRCLSAFLSFQFGYKFNFPGLKMHRKETYNEEA